MSASGFRIAMVGTGMVAGTHLSAIRDAVPPVRLVGLGTRRPEVAEVFADHAQQALGYRPVIFQDIAAVAAADIDAALILTPPNARAGIVRPLAEAGKAILLEKPVARDGREAAEVVEICKKAGVPLGIVFQHRMRTASLKAAGLVASGALGKLGFADIRVPWWRDQSYYDEPGRGTYARDGGGVLISQAIHTIDLALSLTGPAKAVHALTATSRFHRMEAEDIATAGLIFACGAVGSLMASTASFPGTSESVTLHFEGASLHLADGILTASWRDGRVEHHGTVAGTGGGADPMAFTHAWHQGILEDFVTAIRDGREPIVPGREALKSHRLIDAIAASARAGMRVEVPQ
ncbi:MAG: Gfo/Idh/MocA family oxidoreductase [Rhodobacteraceae bacterium]|nr:Gfo/Idh/MocA family oxidoreductase [Paracoccaceae bacterium]